MEGVGKVTLHPDLGKEETSSLADELGKHIGGLVDMQRPTLRARDVVRSRVTFALDWVQ